MKVASTKARSRSSTSRTKSSASVIEFRDGLFGLDGQSIAIQVQDRRA
jgi:hypothetical protein